VTRRDRPAWLFYFLVISAGLINGSAFGQTKPVKTPVKASIPAPAGGNAKALGSKNAPVTIEVFSDFQCPSCRAFYEETSKQLIANYVTNGKVYLIYRDFPLDMHSYSRQASRFANAAAEVGLFESAEGALFDNQDKWAPSGKIEEVVAASFTPAQLKKIRDYQAAHANEINATIERDRMLGLQKAVNQTPSIFVTAHGKTEALPGGTVSYSLMKQYIDFLLRQ
jgi:protein-disulfide isomerase